VRTIDWVDGKIRIIDQTRLPAEEHILYLSTVEKLAELSHLYGFVELRRSAWRGD
jgi:methylthioribose-1-phosphate isomerase